MSRKFIPCLGLALGAAMIAGTPALAKATITEAVLQQATATTSDDLADRIEELRASSPDLADADIEARVDRVRAGKTEEMVVRPGRSQ